MRPAKPRLRIIWLKTGPLHPLDTGGKIRTYNMLRQLSRTHELTYVALCGEGVDEKHLNAASEFSQKQIWVPWKETSKRSLLFFGEVANNFLFSRRPFVIEKYRSRAMAEQIRALDESGDYDLIICDFLTPAVNLFFGDRKPKTRTLLFQHNVESLIWKRLYDKASNPPKRLLFKGQWQRMREYEKAACERCDGVVGVSDEDCALMRSELGLKNVLGAVPTGVDVAFFSQVPPERKPRSLVFLGSMDWMPNIDGVQFFVDDIFPLIKARYPDTRLTIVGRNPPQLIRDMAIKDSNIHVTGTVDDVRPYLAQGEILIVPLRVGGGTRIKIYEGMATGIPVVSTRIGAEGLPVNHGEHILLADSPEDFAREVTCLFEKADLRSRVGCAGLTLVREKFGWESVTKVFEDYCFHVCSTNK